VGHDLPWDAQRDHYSGKKAYLVNIHTQKVVYQSATQPVKVYEKKRDDDGVIVYPQHTTFDNYTGFQSYEPTRCCHLATQQETQRPHLDRCRQTR
jgi:hypothetical protein